MSTIPVPTGGPPPPRLDKYQLLEEEYHRVRDELTQARATIENYDRELRKRNEDLRQASQYINHLQHENQRSKDSFNGLQKELNNVHQQLEDDKALCEVRGKELYGDQVFLTTKADTLSISEVGEKVTALNEEISLAAATLGLASRRRELSQTDLDAASAVSQEILGKKMTNTLIALSQKPNPEVNPLLVQVVLKILMVKFCVSKIQSWYPGDSSIGGFLSAIYSEIHTTEEQAVSGRWRALTRAHTRPSTETWKKELCKNINSVFRIASWKRLRPREHDDSFENRLPSIFNAINELRMAIGEKYTSADLDIFVFECDKIYDPAIMDAYDDGRQSSGKGAPETIVGTTGIGLGKVIAERSPKDARQVRSLIPAKIVLTSTMNEALESTKGRPVEAMDGANQDGRD